MSYINKQELKILLVTLVNIYWFTVNKWHNRWNIRNTRRHLSHSTCNIKLKR